MKKITVHQDLQFSAIIHGLWRLAEWKLSAAELLRLIEECLDLGITTFDHADIYGRYTCEGLFGDALALKPSLRQQMQLVTKCGIKLMTPDRPEQKLPFYDTSKVHIVGSVERSLQNLRTDYIDLLLIHRPDPLMNPEEVAEAFTQLRDQGKVRHFGVSNFTTSQFDMLQSYLDMPLVTNQIEISVLHLDNMQNGTLDHCQMKRIAPMGWSPLGGGRMFTSEDERAVRLRQKLTEIAAETGATSIDQIMYAWLLMHPARIMPIVGSGKLERIKTAVNSLDVAITRQHWFEILKASLGKDVD